MTKLPALWPTVKCRCDFVYKSQFGTIASNQSRRNYLSYREQNRYYGQYLAVPAVPMNTENIYNISLKPVKLYQSRYMSTNKRYPEDKEEVEDLSAGNKLTVAEKSAIKWSIYAAAVPLYFLDSGTYAIFAFVLVHMNHILRLSKRVGATRSDEEFNYNKVKVFFKTKNLNSIEVMSKLYQDSPATALATCFEKVKEALLNDERFKTDRIEFVQRYRALHEENGEKGHENNLQNMKAESEDKGKSHKKSPKMNDMLVTVSPTSVQVTVLDDDILFKIDYKVIIGYNLSDMGSKDGSKKDFQERFRRLQDGFFRREIPTETLYGSLDYSKKDEELYVLILDNREINLRSASNDREGSADKKTSGLKADTEEVVKASVKDSTTQQKQQQTDGNIVDLTKDKDEN